MYLQKMTCAFTGQIRIIESKDLPEVAGIIELHWGGDGLKERFMKRIQDAANHTQESVEQLYRCFVAEEQGEIVGVALLRKVQEFMKQYTSTAHAGEFYISGVKYKGRGIGHALREARIQEAKILGFKEVILYSSESHREAWSFHDKSDFTRVGQVLAPNGEPGVVWRLIL